MFKTCQNPGRGLFVSGVQRCNDRALVVHVLYLYHLAGKLYHLNRVKQRHVFVVQRHLAPVTTQLEEGSEERKGKLRIIV